MINIYIDGSSFGNPGDSGIGVVFLDGENNLKNISRYIGSQTNNVAEYRAVLKGLELAGELGIEEVAYFVDSELVARQLSGIYRIKSEHLKELVLKVKDKEKNFRRVTYQQVPRTHEKIKVVDRLVNLALDLAGA